MYTTRTTSSVCTVACPVPWSTSNDRSRESSNTTDIIQRTRRWCGGSGASIGSSTNCGSGCDRCTASARSSASEHRTLYTSHVPSETRQQRSCKQRRYSRSGGDTRYIHSGECSRSCSGNGLYHLISIFVLYEGGGIEPVRKIRLSIHHEVGSYGRKAHGSGVIPDETRSIDYPYFRSARELEIPRIVSVDSGLIGSIGVDGGDESSIKPPSSPLSGGDKNSSHDKGRLGGVVYLRTLQYRCRLVVFLVSGYSIEIIPARKRVCGDFADLGNV